MKTIVVAAVALAVGVSAVQATTYYPTCNGTKNGYSFDWNKADNWEVLDEATGARIAATTPPQAGDTVVFDSSKTISASSCPNGVTAPLGALIFNSPGTIHQGDVALQGGGQGLVLKGSGTMTWYAGLQLPGTGETPLNIVNAVTFNNQKNVQGTATLVKLGKGTFVNAYEGGTVYYRVPLTKLREGKIKLMSTGTGTGSDFRFDSNDSSIRLILGTFTKDGKTTYFNWDVPNGGLSESEEVQNTAHGIESQSTTVPQYVILSGTPKSDPMVFTGRFYKKAGLIWNPSSANAEFVFSKAVSDTSGELHVSNGVLRVANGASFTALSKLTVATGASFVIEAGSGGGFSAKEIELGTDVKLDLAEGVMLSCGALSAGGTSVDGGFYSSAERPGVKAADWISGNGIVYVNDGSDAPVTPSAATWTGGGADTLVTNASNWNGTLPDLTSGGLTATFGVDGGTATFASFLRERFGGLVFPNAFTLASAVDGAAFVLGGDMSLSGGKVTVGCPFYLTTGQTWTVPSGATLEITAPVGDLSCKGVLLTGGGTVDFKATNAFTCDMMLTNGVYTFTGDDALGGPGGTTGADTRYAHLHFKTGVYRRDLSMFHSGAADSYPVVYIDDGANVIFDGIFKKTGYETLQVGKNSTVTFNGGFDVSGCNSLFGLGNSTIVVDKVPMQNGDRLYLQEAAKPVTLEFRVGNNKVNGFLGNWSCGRMNLRADNAFANGTIGQLNGSFVMDLCGGNHNMSVLVGKGGTVTSERPGMLHLIADSTLQSWDGGATAGRTNKTVFAGLAGFSKEGTTHPHTLAAASSSSGTVQVVAGTLTFMKSGTTVGSWLNASNVVVKGGSLVLEHGKAFGKQVVMDLNEAGKLQLNAGVTVRCAQLFENGVEATAAGTYGSTASAAQHKDDRFFSGTGILKVGRIGSLIYLR